MALIRRSSGTPGGHGRLLVPRVEVATGLIRRLVGLMGRRAIPAEEGLFFPACRAIHTCGMRVAMDAVFVDRDMTVVKVVERIPPYRFPPPSRRAWGVLELGAGRSQELQLRVGDQLGLEGLQGGATDAQAA